MYLSFLFGFVWRLNYKIRGTPKSTKKRGADFPTFQTVDKKPKLTQISVSFGFLI